MRQFTPNFAKLAAPLNKKLRKDQPTTYGARNVENIHSMIAFKKALMSQPVLALKNPTGHTILDTDACTFQVGCVLLQQQQNETTELIDYNGSDSP